jgi:hypothetical protein
MRRVLILSLFTVNHGVATLQCRHGFAQVPVIQLIDQFDQLDRHPPRWQHAQVRRHGRQEAHTNTQALCPSVLAWLWLPDLVVPAATVRIEQ